MKNAEKPQLVLIVEDNEEDYEAVIRSFKKVRVKNPFFWCRSGRMALDYLKHDGQFKDDSAITPGLILLDLNMPGLDGQKTLRFIKEDDGLKQIPVIVLTTSGHEDDILACQNLGADSYIQKPVSFENLIAGIKDVKGFWFEIALQSKDKTEV